MADGEVLIDRYEIRRFLETKHGAHLYRALDRATGLEIILKERPDAPPPPSPLPKSEWSDKAFNNPWQNEFLILRSVSYPTVVKAIDIFKGGDRAYLVLEQLEDRPVAGLLAGRRADRRRRGVDVIGEVALTRPGAGPHV